MLRKRTGSEEVERWRERMWAVPLYGGSTADSREFVTAKPTPCSLGSSGSFPYQRNVNSCSLRLPFEGSLVSCSATMLMLSLLSLWLIMAVFWSHQPVVDHWRGQDTLSWHSSLLVARIVSSISVVSLVQDLQSACWFSPSSKHPMKQADWGRSVPYWLGAAQLEVGGSWPVGLWRSLPLSVTTHSTWTYANQSGPITCNFCLLCCFCHCEQSHWSDLSRVQAWTKCMEILGCPVVRITLSASPMWSKGEQSSTFGIDLAAGAARRKSKPTIQLP